MKFNRRKFLSGMAAAMSSGFYFSKSKDAFAANSCNEIDGDLTIIREAASGAAFLQITNSGGWNGDVEQKFDVSKDIAYLSVTLTDELSRIKDINSLQKPDSVDVSLIAPDGSIVQIQKEAELAGFYLVLQEHPMVGEWSMTITSSAGNSFSCEVRIIPISFTQSTASDDDIFEFVNHLPRTKVDDEFLEFANHALRTTATGSLSLLQPDFLNASLRLSSLGECQSCKIIMGVALLAVGILVIVVAVAISLVSAAWPPLIIIAAGVAKLGIFISSRALAALVVDIVSSGNNKIDTMTLGFCRSFKRCTT